MTACISVDCVITSKNFLPPPPRRSAKGHGRLLLSMATLGLISMSRVTARLLSCPLLEDAMPLAKGVERKSSFVFPLRVKSHSVSSIAIEHLDGSFVSY